MKKTILTTILIILILNIFSFNVFAGEESEFSEVWSIVDDETKIYLNELGIDELSIEELFELSPTRVLEFLVKTVFSTGSKIFENLVLIILVLLITAIVLSFIDSNDSAGTTVSFISAIIIISLIIIPIIRLLFDAVSAIKNTTVFINGYLPIMCAIIIASRNPSLAFTYNSYTLFLSSIISTTAENILLPMIKGIFVFSIISSISQEEFKDRIIKSINRIITILLSLFSTIFTSLLTTQSVLAVSSDSLIMRGIRTISGAIVPIVGGGVGDALSSVFSSFLIMKNTLGIFVIIVIILINLPVLVELLLWYFIITFSSIVSSMVGIEHLTKTLDSIASAVSLLNIIVFFITFIFVISTGVVIMIGK